MIALCHKGVVGLLRICRRFIVPVAFAFGLFLWSPPSALASSILIYGNYATGNNGLQQNLEALGHTVTNQSNALPADLSVYDTIWHVASNGSTLGSAARSALANFVQAGGGLHLTGERPCCESLNDAVETLLNQLVISPQVTVGGQGDVSGIFTFNSGAVANIADAPNNLTNWGPSGPGGMDSLGNLAPENILVSSNNGTVVGAAFDSDDLSGGAGRVTVLMDVNWFTGAAGADVAENLQVFLESAPDVIAMAEPGSALLFAAAGLFVVTCRRRKRA